MIKGILFELFSSLYKKEIDKEFFLQEFYSKTGFVLNEDFCIEKIREALSVCDNEMIDLLVQAVFLTTFTEKSLPIMCELLKSSCHHKHEDIALLLKQIKSPQTVDYLYNATEMQFEYLDYDDTYQFARKCIKALSAIGNENAVNKLRLLSISSNPEIAGYAKKELSRS